MVRILHSCGPFLKNVQACGPEPARNCLKSCCSIKKGLLPGIGRGCLKISGLNDNARLCPKNRHALLWNSKSQPIFVATLILAENGSYVDPIKYENLYFRPQTLVISKEKKIKKSLHLESVSDFSIFSQHHVVLQKNHIVFQIVSKFLDLLAIQFNYTATHFGSRPSDLEALL